LQNSTAMSSRPCGLLPNSIGSLADSHKKFDAGKAGMDAQQLLQFAVDDAPTVVQLLTQVSTFVLSIAAHSHIYLDVITTHILATSMCPLWP